MKYLFTDVILLFYYLNFITSFRFLKGASLAPEGGGAFSQQIENERLPINFGDAAPPEVINGTQWQYLRSDDKPVEDDNATISYP